MANVDLNLDELLKDLPKVSVPGSSSVATASGTTSAGNRYAVTPLFDEDETRAMVDQLVAKGEQARADIQKNSSAVRDIMEKSESGQKKIAEYNRDAEVYKAEKSLETQRWGQELASEMDLTGLLSDLNKQHAAESRELIDLQNKADELRSVGMSDGFFDWFSAAWQLVDVEAGLKQKSENLSSLEARIANVDNNITSSKSAHKHTQSLITGEFIDRLREAKNATYEIEAAGRKTAQIELNTKQIVDMQNADLEQFKAVNSLRTTVLQEQALQQEAHRRGMEVAKDSHIAEIVNVARDRLGKPRITETEVSSARALPNSSAYLTLQEEFSHGYGLARMRVGEGPDYTLPLTSNYADSIDLALKEKMARVSTPTNISKGAAVIQKRAIQAASENEAGPFNLREADKVTQASFINETAAKVAKEHHADISVDGDNNLYKGQPLQVLATYDAVTDTELYREELANLPQDKPLNEQQIFDLGVKRIVREKGYSPQQLAADMQSIFTTAVFTNNTLFSYEDFNLKPQENYNYGLQVGDSILNDVEVVDLTNHSKLLRAATAASAYEIAKAKALTNSGFLPGGARGEKLAPSNKAESIRKLQEFYTKENN